MSLQASAGCQPSRGICCSTSFCHPTVTNSLETPTRAAAQIWAQSLWKTSTFTALTGQKYLGWELCMSEGMVPCPEMMAGDGQSALSLLSPSAPSYTPGWSPAQGLNTAQLVQGIFGLPDPDNPQGAGSALMRIPPWHLQEKGNSRHGAGPSLHSPERSRASTCPVPSHPQKGTKSFPRQPDLGISP